MAQATGPTQLIWDRGCAGTAQAQSGGCLSVGPHTDWSPAQLLVAAAESDLMSVFLRLAEESAVEVLGYISAADAELDEGTARRPLVIVRPCVVVGREHDRARVATLIERTLARSPIARALGDTLRFQTEVVVVPAAEPD